MDLADDPLLLLDSTLFVELWETLERAWQAPFADAVLKALLSPADLYKHCVRGDVLYLELLYRSFLYRYARRTDSTDIHSVVHRSQHRDDGFGAASASGAAGPRWLFRNATALIEATLPRGARPLGAAYKPPTLPAATDQHWFHAGPSGVSRLWMHLNGTEHTRAAIQEVYRGGRGGHAPLVAARLDLRSATRCEAVDLILRTPGPAAAMMLSSHAPAALWNECSELAARGQSGRVGGAAGPFLPADAVVSPPRYWSHRGEWLPEY